MTIVDWPLSLIPLNIAIRPPRKTASMNESLTGFTQAVPVIRPPFGVTVEFDAIEGDDVLTWRALVGALEGRGNVLRLPLFDHWFNDPAAALGFRTSFADGSFFSDGSAFVISDIVGVVASGTQGDRTLSIDFGPYGRALQAGFYFGLGEEPYLATSVTWAGTVATVRITPSLRRTAPSVAVRLRPTLLCQLKDDDSGELLLRNLRWSTPALDLVEVPLGLLS